MKNGFYMNWFGIQKGEGIEFDLLFIAISIALVLKGSGSFSVDRLLMQFKTKESSKTLYSADKVFS